MLNALGDELGGLGEAAEHPGVGSGLGNRLARGVAIHVHKQEPARVPDFGDEGAGLLGRAETLERLGLLVDVDVDLYVLVSGGRQSGAGG